jgi:chromosome partitioning protein
LSTVIAITGRKGGIGKTSITAHLAGEFSGRDICVRVLDTDPQQSLLHWALMGEGLLRPITRAIATTHPEEFRLAVEQARAEATLVLIDTPPGLADPALLAALLADIVLLPVGPSPLDIISLRDALELAREAQIQRGNSGHPRLFFIPSKLTRTNLAADLPEALAAFGEPLLPAIGQRTAVAESALLGLTLAEYAKNSQARSEFTLLATALLEKIT